jgi:tRNA(fMet)-specific endonuclease VapC
VRYLLDTNMCIYALKRRGNVVDHLKRRSPADIAVSTITVAELWFGAVKSSAPAANRLSADAFVFPFDDPAVRRGSRRRLRAVAFPTRARGLSHR